MRGGPGRLLVSWTWLAEETQGDEGAAKLQEGQMDVSPMLVADLQPPKRLSQGERPFDHPAVELNKWRALCSSYE